MSKELHISSLVVSARPDKLDQIEAELGQLAALEIAHVEPNGKIIITLETTNQSQIAETLNHVQLIEGVASAGMVFHQVVETDDAIEFVATE